MASHAWKSSPKTLEVAPIDLAGTITIGASGAVSSFSMRGVSSVVRNSAGNYTVTLDQPYNALLAFHMGVQSASPQSIGGQLASYNLASGTQTLTVNTQAAGVATDPTSGTVLYLLLRLSNSSV